MQLPLHDPLESPREVLRSRSPAPPVRRAWAASRLVMGASYADVPHSIERPGSPEEIAEHVDWEATLSLRRRLDALGFGIAEAMDTAQRFQVGWPVAERLIRECGRLGLAQGFIAGAGVDHLDAVGSKTELIEGVVHQAGTIQAAGGVPMILPMEHLVGSGAGEQDYVEVYGAIVAELDGPLFVHWLGAAFHPGLAGYFPGKSFSRVMALDPARVRGVKLSLLDAELECRVRRELDPRGQVVLTGDDLHFAGLIEGDDPVVRGTSELDGRPLPLGDFSHALLGVLDGVAEPASLALRFLALGERGRYRAIMGPCEAFARWIFAEPTRHYRAGLAFVAWLGGLQANPMLANHEERTRTRDHYLGAADLAARAGALADRGTAQERLAAFLAS